MRKRETKATTALESSALRSVKVTGPPSERRVQYEETGTDEAIVKYLLCSVLCLLQRKVQSVNWTSANDEVRREWKDRSRSRSKKRKPPGTVKKGKREGK
jgi:hypothetical protein